MDEIYISIGGFNLKINFGDTRNLGPKQDHIRKNLEKDLFIYLRSFIRLNRPKNVDYEIVFVNEAEAEVIRFEKNNTEYTTLLRRVSNKKIITNYYISTYQFEIILKEVLFSLLKGAHGFAIHSSTIEVDGKAYLFLGPSGAGKSTIAELLYRKYRVLNDDITMLRRIGSKYYAFQTPFIEKVWWVKKTQQLYEVKKVFLINKSKRFYAEKIKNKELIINIVLSQIFAAQKKEKKMLEEAFVFVGKFKEFYNLYFGKDDEKLAKVLSSLT